MESLNQLVAEYLAEYKTGIDGLEKLNRIYNWTTTSASLDALKDLKIVADEKIQSIDLKNDSGLVQHQKLCKILSPVLELNDPNAYEKAVKWIVSTWGGINKGQDTLIGHVNDFFGTEHPKFYRIASTSKIGAFKNPEKYIIYDSRVATMLNWIILYVGGDVFFRFPPGRNTTVLSYELPSLIKSENGRFLTENETYFQANEFIKSVSRLLWDNNEALFYTQQLLFALAIDESTKNRISAFTPKTK